MRELRGASNKPKRASSQIPCDVERLGSSFGRRGPVVDGAWDGGESTDQERRETFGGGAGTRKRIWVRGARGERLGKELG
jgi:hypothetical protein